ncbi:MAG TPA: DUF3794 domain-containing protein [Firmicutes bacterium]|nr:DUF3794 domain-containing protein [Bacillota bacterium]
MQQVSEVSLPMRAIAIKEVHAEVRDVRADIIIDKVVVQGNVAKQVFFVGEDSIVHHFSDAMRFSAMVPVPGAAPGMFVQVRPEITNIITELVRNGSAIIQKVILDVFVKVTDIQQLRIAQDPYGLVIFGQVVVGESTVQELESATVGLPSPAVKVNEIRVTFQNLSVSIQPDRIFITGDIAKQVFYVGPDDMTRHQPATIPFSVTADIPGAMPGMDVQVHPSIRDISFALSPDGLQVSEEILFDVFVKVTQRSDVAVAVGEGPTVVVDRLIGQGTSQVGESSQVTLSRPATSLVGISAVVSEVRARAVQDKVILRGTISKEVTYIGDDGLTHTDSFDIPFNDFVAIPGAAPSANVFVTARVAGVVFDPAQTGQVISEEVVVDTSVVLTEDAQVQVVLDPAGVLLKLPAVVGEGMAQVMAEVIVERVGPVAIAYDRLVFEEPHESSRQHLVESVIPLPEPAIKIKSSSVEVVSVESQVMTGKVIVQGTVRVEIQFVGQDNIVRAVSQDIPFSTIEEFPDARPGVPVEVTVEVEGSVAKLTPDMSHVHELVILRIRLSSMRRSVVQVVVMVRGDGIVATSTRIRANVLRDDTPTPAELDVVTDVTGPRVKEVFRTTVYVDVVDDGIPGPVPLSVVTDITFWW